MTNYSKLTDDEIDKMVDDILYPSVIKEVIPKYCSDIVCSWSVIFMNSISIFSEWDENGTINDSIWTATTNLDKSWTKINNDGLDHSHTNPLRAAMVVFLMLKDTGND